MENMKDKVVEGLKQFVFGEHQGNKASAARDLGLKHMTLVNWLEGNRTPNLEALQPVFEALGWQIVFPGQSIRDYARILQMRDTDASAHDLAMANDDTTPESVLEFVAAKRHHRPDVMFSPEILKELRLDAADALLYTTHSDALSPLIRNGAQVLVDRTKTAIEDGAIYLIHLGTSLVLRRITRDVGRLLLSGKPELPVLYIAPEQEAEMKILGKVVWVGNKI